MESRIVAGEPADILLAALQHRRFRKDARGMIRVSARMTAELGEPLSRAIERVERELLALDEDRGRDVHARTEGARRADALVVLAKRVAEAVRRA